MYTRGEELKKQNWDIVAALLKEPFFNQRRLSEISNHSLGIVNKAMNELLEKQYINEEMQLTLKALEEIEMKRPQKAIILAAGFGMRMVPINLEMPKALMEANGEVFIERIIRQLHEVNVYDITVVVGFMKEKFEYLIDDYGVELIVNSEYAHRNNLYSLKLAMDKIENAYIIPSDIWCEKNPFSTTELYSWYMISDLVDDESMVRLNRKEQLVRVRPEEAGNQMIGIAYILKDDALQLQENMEKLSQYKKNYDMFWEEALFQDDRMMILAKVVRSSDVVEVNTYEELRDLDEESNHLKSDAIDLIKSSFGCNDEDIQNISVLKKGMTNRSFLFNVAEKKYIMRIPGEGTDELINRRQEAAVYEKIQNRNICDDVIYMNSSNGYKITEYLDNARVCDPHNEEDIKRCMRKLKEFHQLALKVNHTFDIFEKIDFYESLWTEKKSIYRDYEKTKTKVVCLKDYINAQEKQCCLTHIDAVPDNFLFMENGDIRLIDWEYAGMQDPHVDIAMFCIYSMYEKEEADRLIDLYFEGKCAKETRIKIYAYISCCGLLWSNWCEYKLQLGVEFGEYSLRQYRYAKEYYKLVEKELEKENA